MSKSFTECMNGILVFVIPIIIVFIVDTFVLKNAPRGIKNAKLHYATLPV